MLPTKRYYTGVTEAPALEDAPADIEIEVPPATDTPPNGGGNGDKPPDPNDIGLALEQDYGKEFKGYCVACCTKHKPR